MGYTHYHSHTRDFTDAEWDRLLDAARKIIAVADHDIVLAWEFDEPNRAPQLDGDCIRFNGIGDQGCETFLLTKENEDPYEFTKTNREPYDVVVVAVLAAADAIAPGALKIGSDGTPDEWKDGIALADRAEVVAQVPAGVTP